MVTRLGVIRYIYLLVCISLLGGAQFPTGPAEGGDVLTVGGRPRSGRSHLETPVSRVHLHRATVASAATVVTSVTAVLALTTVNSAEAAARQRLPQAAAGTPVWHVHHSRAADVRRLATIKRQTTRSAALKVRALARQRTSAGRAHLHAGVLSAVHANMAADASLLTRYGKQAAKATTISTALRARHLVATTRPALYHRSVGLLVWGARTTAKLDGVNASVSRVTRLVDAKEAEGADVTTARAAAAAAGGATRTAARALGASKAAAVMIKASSPPRGAESPVVVSRVEAHQAVVALGRARAKVEQATAALEAASVQVAGTALPPFSGGGIETFQSLPRGLWDEGTTHGDWSVQYDGYGTVKVVGNTNRALRLQPTVNPPETGTSAAMVTSRSASEGDVTVEARMRTLAQNAPSRKPARKANPWETAWLWWNLRYEPGSGDEGTGKVTSEVEKGYYLVLKPNGWELGKVDQQQFVGYGGQRYLRTGSTPKFPVGAAWRNIKIQQVGATITVTADGKRLTRFTDGPTSGGSPAWSRHPQQEVFTRGKVGLYVEDAVAQFDDIRRSTS